MTEALREAQPRLNYEASGDAPERTVAVREKTTLVHMMSEIGAGVFVAWETCSRCGRRVWVCQCTGGPKEPDYIARWREEHLASKPLLPGARPAPQSDATSDLVSAGIDHTIEELRKRAEEGTTDVDF